MLRLRRRNHRALQAHTGPPVFCRSCFQLKRVPAAVAKAATLDQPAYAVEQAVAEHAASLSTAELIAETPVAVLGVETMAHGMEFATAETADA